VSFQKGSAEIVYEEDQVTREEIFSAIENKGYRVAMGKQQAAHPVLKVLPIFIILIALYLIIRYTIGFSFINAIPQIDTAASITALFIAGLLTGIHCIAMCGGINLSQSVRADDINKAGGRRFAGPLLYNLGRIISYTVVGGIVGGIGSALSLSNTVKGVIMAIAAVFMILISLSMLGWLPKWLTPRLPAKLAAKSEKAKKGKGPLVVGLLNGLMPCGPLQAMQLYALSTGSVWMGALSMFVFSIGTVPMMLGAGIIFSLLRSRFTKMIARISAALIILMAVIMLFSAAGFFGWSLFASEPAAIASNDHKTAGEYRKSGEYTVANLKDGYQEVAADVQQDSYPQIIVQKGIPVKFNLRAEKAKLNGCNSAIQIPEFNISKKLLPGDNIVEFTPDKKGSIPYTCWMSMIKSTIMVVDDVSKY
jgi:uncharacterized protein